MLTRLILQDFGKFRDRSFDLGAMTLVYGPNEAGKTTFFDGLFQALCKPSETKKTGKLLRDRYGSQRRAAVAPIPVEPWPEDEFLSLYAIRSGDLKLEWSPGSDWMEKLKAGLYHGGVDPRSLAEEFEKKSSDRRNFAHMKELETLRAQVEKVRAELNALLAERQGHLRREQDLAGLNAALQETRKLRDAAREAAVKLDVERVWQEKIQLRQKLQGQWELLRNWESLDAAWRATATLRAAKKSDWEGLLNATREAAAKAQSLRGKLELQAESRSRAIAEWRQAQAGMARATEWSVKAKEIAQTVRTALAESRQPVPTPKNHEPLVAAGVVGLLGTVAGGVVYRILAARSQSGLGWELAVGLSVLALLAAAALYYFGRRRRLPDPVTRELPWATWKDQWLIATGGEDQTLAPLTTPEGILSALEEKGRLRETQARLEQDTADRMRRHESEYAALNQEFSTAQSAQADAQKKESDWLTALGARDGEDFLVRYAQAQKADQERIIQARQIQSLAETVEGEYARIRPASNETLQGSGGKETASVPDGTRLAAMSHELQRKLQTLDDEGVPVKGLDEAGLQRLRSSLKTQRDSEQVQDLREREALARKAELAGEIRGATGRTATLMVAAEERLARAESDLAVKEMDKEAAALACDIFRGIGEGTDLLLAGLAQEISGMLANLFPQERKVALTGLGDKQLKVEDATGQNRILEWLSKGTQDSVVLAAKLAIALKTRGTPGLLVLDDPFLAMDETRESLGLELLRAFLARGWQIVLLTKEVRLREKVPEMFPDALVHDLTLLPRAVPD